MEWMVCCRRDSTTTKGDPVAKDITCLKLGPEAVYPRKILNILLFGLFWLAERSRVIDLAIVRAKASHESPDPLF